MKIGVVVKIAARIFSLVDPNIMKLIINIKTVSYPNLAKNN
jgi:hypothetical protein